MKNYINILILSAMLASCSTTVERLKRVGQPPEFANMEVPASEEDNYDSEERAAIYEQRKMKTNSLWQPGSKTFFRDSRAWKVGDIIKIIVKVSDSADLNNSSDQGRSGKDSLGIPSVFGKEKAVAKFLSHNGDPASMLDTNMSRKHSGSGKISRKETIQTVIAAVVTQILNNGNLVLLGRQEIRVNNELREIKVTGIIRPRDISADNSVSSDQIAEARISYGGRGTISDMQQPRVGSQVVDIISPF
jgi:flagellar L-ring protein FlgH